MYINKIHKIIFIVVNNTTLCYLFTLVSLFLPALRDTHNMVSFLLNLTHNNANTVLFIVHHKEKLMYKQLGFFTYLL